MLIWRENLSANTGTNGCHQFEWESNKEEIEKGFLSEFVSQTV